MSRFARAVALWGSWLFLGVLLADAGLVFINLSVISRSNEHVDQSRKIVIELQSTLSSLKDAETGQRGFLLTGRDDYLEPYHSAGKRVANGLDQLFQLSADHDDQQARLLELKRIAGEKLAELQETIRLRREVGLEHALRLVETDRGKDLMIAFKKGAEEFQSDESQRLTIRLAESKSAIRWTIATFSLTTCLALALLVAYLLLQRRDAAEKEKAAAAIRESEAWLSTTLTSIGDALIATDDQGNVRFMNPVAESLTGWSRDEAVGRPMNSVFDIVNETTGAPVENPVDKVIREGLVVGLANHTILIAKGGSKTPIEDSAAPIHDAQGKIIGVVMVFRDVTKARRAERELRESEARKAAILEAALDCIITVDQEGKIVEVNPAVKSTFGLGREEALGQTISHLIEPISPDVGLPFEQGASSILGQRIEVTGIRADSVHFPVELAVTKIKAEGPPLYTAYLRDIDAKKRAEAEREHLLDQLEGERRHLETVIQSSRDCFTELDLEGRILGISGIGRQLLDIPDDWVISDQPWLEFWDVADRDAAKRALSKAMEGGVGSFEGRFIAQRASEKYWDVIVTAIRNLQGRAERLLAVSRDITERRRHADERERLLAETQEASRAKSQFLAILSHELRTPLNPILLAVTSMIDRPTPPDDVRPTLEMIRHNVNLQARLIDDLLDVMRIVQGKMPLHWTVADCHDVIQHAVMVCQSEVFGKVIQLSLDLAAEHHYVNADSARLQQVFWNLIKNAVKFSPQGGKITIRTRQEPKAGLFGERLVIEVSDTGIGIDPAVLTQIFDPFQQGETSITRKFGGLGLGLAICKGVVDAHGGTIVAESEGKGRGTTFKITLDALATPKLVKNGRHHADSGDLPFPSIGSTIKILVVEDEAATRKLMARLLRGLGHEVKTAGTIAEAAAAAEKERFGLIVSDIGLPDGSGLDLMRTVVARHGKIPSIALTGYGMEEDIVRSREAGFTTHMTKPIDFTKLEAMIRQVAR